MTDDADSAAKEPSNKIDRTIQKYGIEGLGDELERRWLGDEREKESTRDLAEYFNKEVLSEVVRESETSTLSGNVDEVYRALMERSEMDSTLVRSRLEQSGIDVEEVTSDFVSHQTVYRYFKDHREVERSDLSPKERRESAIETIQRLRGRTTAVTEQTVSNLENNDVISVGEFSVLNDLQVLCEGCGQSYGVAPFLEQGGCECQSE